MQRYSSRTKSKKRLIKKAGFTLLELLISVALLSILLGALYSSFLLSHKAVSGLDDSLLKLQEARTAVDIMGRETDSVLYTPGGRNTFFKIEDRDLYGKQASRFTFTAFSPLIPGLSLLSYYVEEKDGTVTLFKTIKEPSATAVEKGVEIIDGIESFSVEANDGGKWVRTWDAAAAGKIPEEIRLTITVLIKERPVTLYETITPKIGKRI